MKSITKTNERKVISKLRGLLECNICYSGMIGHIWQCQNGHLMCVQCKTKCKSCPYCKTTVNNRNLAIEQLLEHFNVQCLHNNCFYRGPRSRMQDHCDVCRFKPVTCIFCNECLPPTTLHIQEHLVSKHNSKVCASDLPCHLSYVHKVHDNSDNLRWHPRIVYTNKSRLLVLMRSTYNNYIVSVVEMNDYGVRNIQNMQIKSISPHCDTTCILKELPSIRTWNVNDAHLTFNKKNAITENDKIILHIEIIMKES